MVPNYDRIITRRGMKCTLAAAILVVLGLATLLFLRLGATASAGSVSSAAAVAAAVAAALRLGAMAMLVRVGSSPLQPDTRNPS